MCNGSTPDSDSVCEGSNPSSAAKSSSSVSMSCFFICRLAPRTRTKQIKSAHEVPKALRGFESFIRCQKQFTGFGELLFLLAAWHQNKIKLSSPSDELSFTVGTFRTENIRRQLPRRAFETIRDYPRICAMPTSMTADETYPTLCSLCKRPEQPQGTAALQTV